MSTFSPETLGAITAIASSIAAIAAVFVTWNAPRSAAKYAEKLRAQNEAANALRNQKLRIFNELMKTRGVRVTREAVEAFNLIDVVFKDSASVKDAWAELISLYNRFEATPPALINEKLLVLLKEIAEDLSLSSQLRSADFERFYYPTAIAEEDQAKAIRQKAVLQQFERHNVNTASQAKPFTVFPPRPT